MYKFMVRVSQTSTQTRISIPKIIAKQTGLDRATIAMIESMEDKSIVIKEWKPGNEEKRDIQKNPNRSD